MAQPSVTIGPGNGSELMTKSRSLKIQLLGILEPVGLEGGVELSAVEAEEALKHARKGPSRGRTTFNYSRGGETESIEKVAKKEGPVKKKRGGF